MFDYLKAAWGTFKDIPGMFRIHMRFLRESKDAERELFNNKANTRQVRRARAREQTT
jgi:hypothetical protein